MVKNKERTKNKLNPGNIIALVSLLASLFFLSPNLTGNVIGSFGRGDSNFLSLILFVFGVTAFLIMKNR
jgi:hypothetical protein